MSGPCRQFSVPTHLLVICSLSRPTELKVAIDSALAQSTPISRVIVVDGSPNGNLAPVVQNFQRSHPNRVQYLTSKPGLALQRNIGINYALDNVDPLDGFLHFVDDDVILHSTYIEAMEAAFLRHPGAICIGGRDVLRGKRKHHLLGRITQTDSLREGSLLKSGFNITIDNLTLDTKVDWVSGLSQSFRLHRLGNLRFDESIRFFGEEVDMHVRCGQRGEIIWTPTAELRHSSSEIDRPESDEATYEMDLAKYKLCLKYPDKFRLRNFYFATSSHLIIKYFQGMVLRNRNSYQIARGHLRFMVKVFREK